MSIETNNKPYFDDFDISKNFLKVLFKPSVSVQTRELNQLQSIIQNQIGILSDSIYLKSPSCVNNINIFCSNEFNIRITSPSPKNLSLKISLKL